MAALSNKAFKYLVCDSFIKKFEAFKYSFIMMRDESLGLYKNSNIALLTITDTRTLDTDKSGNILVEKIPSIDLGGATQIYIKVIIFL